MALIRPVPTPAESAGQTLRNLEWDLFYGIAKGETDDELRPIAALIILHSVILGDIERAHK